MPLDVLLLILRAAITLSLYGFLITIVYLMRHDLKVFLRIDSSDNLPVGKLTIIGVDADLDISIGQEFPLKSQIVIGRGIMSDLVLPDSFASSDHARITLRNNQWWLEDSGSRNGTKLNGTTITESTALAPNDMIGVGRVQLKIDFEQNLY